MFQVICNGPGIQQFCEDICNGRPSHTISHKDGSVYSVCEPCGKAIVENSAKYGGAWQYVNDR